MKEYVVRVVIPDIDNDILGLAKPIDGAFLECLRYAGIVKIHTSDTGQVFDIRCPDVVKMSKNWANANADRMKSFGYNAVAAPAYE